VKPEVIIMLGITAVLDVLILNWLFGCFAPRSTIRRVWQTLVWVGWGFFMFWGSIWIPNKDLKFGISLLLAFGVFFTTRRGSFSISLLAILFNALIVFASDHFATGIMMFFFNGLSGMEIVHIPLGRVIGAGFCYAYQGLVLLLYHKYKLRGEQLSPKSSWMLIGITGSLSFVILVVYEYIKQIADLSPWAYLATSVFVALTNLFMLVFCQTAADADMQRKMQAVLSSQMDFYSTQYTVLESHMNQIRAMDHDYRHHLALLASFASGEKWAEFSAYVEELRLTSFDTAALSLSGNWVVDSLLRVVHTRAEETEFVVNTAVPTELGIPKPDLCIIISNTVNNAVDACNLMPSGLPRKVEFNLFVKDPYLWIEVKNTMALKPTTVNGRMVSTKPDKASHGFGITNTKYLLEKHGGYGTIETTDDTFTFTGMMRLSDDVLKEWKLDRENGVEHHKVVADERIHST